MSARYGFKEVQIYHEGALAFMETFRGCVPCRVVKIETRPQRWHPELTETEVLTEVTEDVNYCCGELRYSKGYRSWWPERSIIPRNHRYLRGIYYWINTQFKWVSNNENTKPAAQAAA